MHVFRSEEHLKNWAQFDSETQDGMVQLKDLVELFSIGFFQKRLEPDYFSHQGEYMADFFPTLKKIGKSGPFWIPPGM